MKLLLALALAASGQSMEGATGRVRALLRRDLAMPLGVERVLARPAPKTMLDEPPGGSLGVMTLNVAGVPIVDSTRPERMKRIGERLRTAAADIVGLQELYEKDDLAQLAAQFPHAAFAEERPESRGLLYRNLYTPRAWGSGLAILSRHPITTSKLFYYSIHSPQSKDYFLRRGVLAARIQTPLGPLDVYNTHMTHPEESVAPRLMQLFELFEATEKFSGDRPYIVMGDLNFTPYSLEWQVALALFGSVDPCMDLAAIDRCGPTNGPDGRLDYILLSGDGEIDLIGAFLNQKTPAGDFAYSDHLALAARISAISFPRKSSPGQRRLAAFRRIASELDNLIGEIDEKGSLSGYWSSELVASVKELRERLERRLDPGY